MDKRNNIKNKSTERRQQGITRIAVCGFKSLNREQHIEVKPLTILAGANSSGKSSIMQPLLLLKQTLEAQYDPGALLLNGPNVRLTSAEQLLSKNSNIDCKNRFFVKFDCLDNWELKLTYAKELKKGLDIVDMHFYEKEVGRKIKLYSGMSQEEIIESIPTDLKQLVEQLKLKNNEILKWSINRKRCFLYIAVKKETGLKSFTIFEDISPTSLVQHEIERIIHLPGLRGNPERTYNISAIGSEFPGTFENYVASVVYHWQSTKNMNLKLLCDALETMGLTWKVEAKQVDDTKVELKVGRLAHGKKGGAKDLVSIADVGFGVSQTLPVMVALLVAKPGQIVYLEQPEIHLHPKAQFALSKIIADAANRGVKVIIETHSELLLLGVQALVAEGKLLPKKVKLHWFTRSKDGSTEIKSADLDKSGSFGDWPEDFSEIALNAQSEYMDAAERQRLTI